MARSALSPQRCLSIRVEDLEDIRHQIRSGWDLAGALRLLADVQEVPAVVSGERDLAAVRARMDRVFRTLPSLMRVMAEGVDAWIRDGVRAVDVACDHAAPRFRLKAGRELGEVPAAFLRLQDPCLDQSALRKAHARGELPECLEWEDLEREDLEPGQGQRQSQGEAQA